MDQQTLPYIATDRRCGPYKFDLHIEDRVGQEWYDTSADLWQRERQWCMDTIKPGSFVIDCGAHQGIMSMIFASATGPTGCVHAWEPSLENAALIRRNAALNGIANIIVHPQAVGDKSGRVSVQTNEGNVVVASGEVSVSSNAEFDIVRLDDQVKHFARVDFIKFDVEGNELSALRGATQVLKKRPFIMLELHNFLFNDRLATVAEIVGILQGHGYDFWIDDFVSATPAGSAPDIAALAALKHAQLYCTPV